MNKCLKCGKECASYYRYCKDCYSDYYIGNCDICYKAIYNDGKDDYVSVGKNDLYHIDCYIKKNNFSNVNVDELNEKIKKIDSELSELKVKYDEKVKENTFLEDDIKDLIDKNEKLSLENDNYKEEFSKLSESISSFKMVNEKLENVIKQLTEDKKLLSNTNKLLDEFTFKNVKKNDYLITEEHGLCIVKKIDSKQCELYNEFRLNCNSIININDLKLQNKTYIHLPHKMVDRELPVYKCDDGHKVRSKDEMIIDNWLYQNNIKHIYEEIVYNKNNPSEMFTSDWYLPNVDLYIEYWGVENSKRYDSQKEWKRPRYKGYNLLELETIDVKNGLIELKKMLSLGKLK